MDDHDTSCCEDIPTHSSAFIPGLSSWPEKSSYAPLFRTEDVKNKKININIRSNYKYV
jgi:hypothetical protein